MPDIFIPTDTGYRSDYLLELNSKGILYEFAFDYANEHRNELEEIGRELFVKEFNIDRSMIENLQDFAKSKGLVYNKDEFTKSGKMILTQLKALISRNIWRDDGFYKVYNPIDPTYNRAIEVING